MDYILSDVLKVFDVRKVFCNSLVSKNVFLLYETSKEEIFGLRVCERKELFMTLVTDGKACFILRDLLQ